MELLRVVWLMLAMEVLYRVIVPRELRRGRTKV